VAGDNNDPPEIGRQALSRPGVTLQKVGSKYMFKRTTDEEIIKIAKQFSTDGGKIIDPENEDPPKHEEAGKFQLGTFLMNYRVRAFGKGLIAVCYEKTTTIDIIRGDDAQRLIDCIHDLDPELEVDIRIIYLKDMTRPKVQKMINPKEVEESEKK